MDDDPDSEHFKESGLIRIILKHKDEEGILLMPNIEKKERAVMNPSVYQNSLEGPWPFVYRSEKITQENGMQKIVSNIDLRWLISPTQLSKESRTIIKPEEDYEKEGCEDPRITKIGTDYFITYVAYDGLNARPALAITTDFWRFKKLGVIGPSFPIEKGVEVVGDEEYKRIWRREIREKKEMKVPLLLFNKDSAIQYSFEQKEWRLFNRLGRHIQIARARNLEDFKDNLYWEMFLKNIRDYEFIRAGSRWGRLKVGLGCLGPDLKIIENRRIGIFHGVNNRFSYRASFFEYDENGRVISIIEDPLFEPDKDVCKFNYRDGEKTRTKRVIFPTGIIRDPVDEDNLWIYSGIGDKIIGYRSTSLSWLFSELDKNKLVFKY